MNEKEITTVKEISKLRLDIEIKYGQENFNTKTN